jgi:tripartite-type tricarboxylate transporter receptor subunit TctC
MLKRMSILVMGTIFLLLGASEIFAQKYPDRPITLVIPMAPGDGLDIAGRLMGEELSKLLKVPIVPLNKPGATATLGTDMVVKAKKDGYTILLTNCASLVNAKILQPEIVPYDPFKDLTPLGLCTVVPLIIVARKDAPYKNVKELVDYAKKNPGKIRYGTSGANSTGDLNVWLFQMFTRVEMIMVPFKGASPAVTALLGGHIDVVSIAITPLLSHLRSKEIKGIVISKKPPEFPDIPTIKQLGYSHNLLDSWNAYFAPSEVPTEITETLVPAIENVVRNPAIASKLADLGIQSEYEPPDKIFIRMSEEYKVVEEIAKKFRMVK